MPSRFTSERVDHLIATLEALHAEALHDEASLSHEIELVAGADRPSARNLIHYSTLRNHDVRGLQTDLARLGLSSLGRSEAHVLAAIEAVLAALHRIAGRTSDLRAAVPVDFESGPALLAAHALELFGPTRANRDTRLLATLPSEAARDPAVVRDLLAAGMDMARINCSHDDAAAWEAMLTHLAAARTELGLPCLVLFDLAGPKLRTAPLAPGPRVIHVRPPHDARGVPLRPARVLLSPSAVHAATGHACDVSLPLAGPDLARLAIGDVLCLNDTRGKARELRLVARHGDSWIAECPASAWIEDGCVLEARDAERWTVAGLAPVANALALERGSRLWLVPEGGPHERDGVPCIGCTLPEVLADLLPGERVYFDDGKLGGTIRAVDSQGVAIEITSARPGGALLRADKGINLPDSHLSIAGLTEKDRADLDFVASRANLVGLSFVRSAQDVLELQHELELRGADSVGILVKVETRQAFDYLPSILLAGMRSPPLGVMVARGDLAVEVGFERLAEVQEEILWLCEAAHVPVVWATQVLDTLTRKGQPSRAEVTDAAMAGRAECVMLNKGPHATLALHFLDDVLGRMQQHQAKKRALLRRLSVSGVERMRDRELEDSPLAPRV